MTDRPVLCCPDKFRGSLTAPRAAEALAVGVERAGRPAIRLPLADGGEGTLDALCPSVADRRRALVRGPLGAPVDAEWGMRGDVAVVEMARASGLALVAGANEPLAATTHGTGELIRAALDAGAERILVAVGGSATTDGGLGALEALAERYRVTLGVDVRGRPGAGAAGGLAGGLAAVGAHLVPGAALVGNVVCLREKLSGASVAITGEGRLDATSLAGKVVGHVLEEARALRTPVAVVAGDVEPRRLPSDVPWRSLVERAGSTEVALRDAASLAADAAESLVRGGLNRT